MQFYWDATADEKKNKKQTELIETWFTKKQSKKAEWYQIKKKEREKGGVNN